MQTEQSTPPRWHQRRAAGFVFPLLLVVIGAVLLLNNLGILPWSVWTALGQLWPVILILLGIDLLLGRRNAWLGATVAAITLLVVLGVAIWMSFTGVGLAAPTAVSDQQSAAVPLAGVTDGKVIVHFGAGVLNLGSLPETTTNFAQATASLPTGMQLSQHTSTRGGTADVTFDSVGSASFWPFRGLNQNRNNMSMDVAVARHIPLTIQVEVGAGQSDFDLSSLTVREFTLNNGAGRATVSFPESAGQTTADIHSGAGQLTLVIPSGVGAAIHNNSGLVNLRVPPDRFQRTGDGYQTADYATAPNRLDVTLHVGFGEVDVK